MDTRFSLFLNCSRYSRLVFLFLLNMYNLVPLKRNCVLAGFLRKASPSEQLQSEEVAENYLKRNKRFSDMFGKHRQTRTVLKRIQLRQHEVWMTHISLDLVSTPPHSKSRQ